MFSYSVIMSLTISEEKPKITQFLTANQIGVLATADSSGQPHAATIYFVIDPDLNVYFITKEKTIKYKNLVQNNKAALAVYEPSSQSTVQIIGNTYEVTDNSRIDDVFRRLLTITANTSESAVPPVSKLNAGEYKCFCIKPSMVRLAEYTKSEHGQHDDLFDTAVMPDNEL
jgi:general stress protein 26